MRILLLFATISVALAETDYNPLSDEYIAEINSKQSTWTAGRNFDVNTPWSKIQRLASGVLPEHNKISLRTYIHEDEQEIEIPTNFDARDRWSSCSSVKQIRDQSNCGSCWAFAAVEAMSDRICIASEGAKQVFVSAEDLLSCCTVTCGDGCGGGYPAAAWTYWATDGISTGGLYQANYEGCRAYSLPPCEHHTTGSRVNCSSLEDFETPKCLKKCDDDTYLTYSEELTFAEDVYSLSSNVLQIQVEILKNGPVEASFDVYDDFPLYKSGIYQRTSNKNVGGHAVKIIGWGEEKGVSYWLIANSWNSDWGDNGFFKMIKGVNNCGIESNIVAGKPNLSKLK